jgi:hypothetical protein
MRNRHRQALRRLRRRLDERIFLDDDRGPFPWGIAFPEEIACGPPACLTPQSHSFLHSYFLVAHEKPERRSNVEYQVN